MRCKGIVKNDRYPYAISKISFKIKRPNQEPPAYAIQAGIKASLLNMHLVIILKFDHSFGDRFGSVGDYQVVNPRLQIRYIENAILYHCLFY